MCLQPGSALFIYVIPYGKVLCGPCRCWYLSCLSEPINDENWGTAGFEVRLTKRLPKMYLNIHLLSEEWMYLGSDLHQLMLNFITVVFIILISLSVWGIHPCTDFDDNTPALIFSFFSIGIIVHSEHAYTIQIYSFSKNPRVQCDRFFSPALICRRCVGHWWITFPGAKCVLNKSQNIRHLLNPAQHSLELNTLYNFMYTMYVFFSIHLY